MAVDALLTNVAARASLLLFAHIRRYYHGLGQHYGACENGHAADLQTVFARVAAVDDRYDARAYAHAHAHAEQLYACKEKMCNGYYDSSVLTPFFTRAHSLLVGARWAWHSHIRAQDGVFAVDGHVSCPFVCTVCGGTRGVSQDGIVITCSLCDDVTCTRCMASAHPGIACGTF